ncbi:hypothetical protein PFLUV_G00063250 [Perca fluviatilis]|uniref:UBZ2-type domain-containing protein n=1 Tax=Perca fluviatilis TaxID=8168 RepID=A0A6A5FKL8_PERFL|nr:Fanconi anemia core complex-associated protein 20 [Perca fluviatilis]XP_039656627.1 Fanconi anemia core complex-associated protein 20 [Perca fluviatilis]XP_039656628.1 Fanconi anemia core complex-associated protein 20 [Perca fluviatilis]XP_039656629.1 Fanconi anemia core complex-associated protein 20 [Perca fluviatilis]KAF1390933.1 hypothetical protein PFLUV_G00063250 [Perca fluviatilis]
MAETYSKSKLKRNKPSVKDVQPGTGSRGTLKRSPTETAEAGRAAWWTSEPLPAVESLWALCALPCLENRHRDLVPDLPHPSTARPTALRSGEQRWCDLSEDVAPFPEPSPPSPRTRSSPSPSPRELSVQTQPVPDPADRQLSSRGSQRPRPSLHGWEGPPSSAGPSRAGGGEGRRGRETGPLLTGQAKVSDGRVPLQRKGEDREEEEGQSRVGGDGGAAGGAGLQSCPMCLLDFPVGFTQMDCDGHLAQCLSEVNVDMTW